MEEAIAAFLRAHFYPRAHTVRVDGLRTMIGGSSRETFACECLVEREDGEEVRMSLILRRDPPPEREILRNSRAAEHHLLNRLAERTSIPVPRSLFLDATGDAFSRPTMLIERFPGSEVHDADLYGDPDRLEVVATRLCEFLAELHTTPVALLDPEGEYRDPGGVGIDTGSWDRYMWSTLGYLKRNYPAVAFEPMPLLYDIYTALGNRLPPPTPLVLTHGDVRPTNVLYDDGAISAMIDWESAHVGDPREDLGLLAQFQFRTGLDLFGAVKADGGFLGHYSKLTGIPVTPEDVRFFTMFGACTFGVPLLAAIKRRLEGDSGEFGDLLMIQGMLAGALTGASLMGYPPPEDDYR